MADKKVTDPELLKKLNAGAGSAAPGGKKVTDPKVLHQLNGGTDDDWADDDDLDGIEIASEGLSGVNEGLADLISLPSQILEGALSIGPFIANTLGRETAYPDYVPDLGEPARDAMENIGAIREPIDDPRARIVRRVGREIGRNSVPALGVASRAVQPLRTLAAETGMTLGSGSGGALANEIAPGNVGAEVAGQVLGGLTAGGLMTAGRKAITPLPADADRLAAAESLKKRGVELSAGQRTGSKGLQYAESELGGGAAQALTERQAQQFTSAALKEAGVSAPKATPEVIDQAFKDIGNDFDNLVSGTTILADRKLGLELRTIQDDFNDLTGDAVRPKAVEKRINDIVAKIQQGGGTMSGEAYKAMRTEIDDLAKKSSNPELKGALLDIRNAMDDAVERTLSSANSPLVGDWQDARKRYHNLMIVTDAVARSTGENALGIITPANLRSAAALSVGKKTYARGRSDMGELGREGSATMTPLPQSGTAPRTAVRNLAATGPAIVGAAIGTGVNPGLGTVLGGLTGAVAPRVLGGAMLSGPGRAYLGNQLMRPRLDPRGVSVGSGVTMTLSEYEKTRPLEITVSGGAN
jgi:hypothetical protein